MNSHMKVWMNLYTSVHRCKHSPPDVASCPAVVGTLKSAKTFKRLTDATLAWQTERFLELETHREGITVFVRPEMVAEIALDGVQTSTRYPGGVALRFARLKTYRSDKNPSEADTIDSVRSLLLATQPPLDEEQV